VTQKIDPGVVRRCACVFFVCSLHLIHFPSLSLRGAYSSMASRNHMSKHDATSGKHFVIRGTPSSAATSTDVTMAL
jgi:hypothetical protein